MKPTARRGRLKGRDTASSRTDAAVQAARAAAAAPLPARLRSAARISKPIGWRPPRFWAVAVGHLAVFALVFWLAFLLRFDSRCPCRATRREVLGLAALDRGDQIPRSSSSWAIMTAGGPT